MKLLIALDAASRRIRVDEANEGGRYPGAVAADRRVAGSADLVVHDEILGADVGNPGLIPTCSVLAGGVGDGIVGDVIELDGVLGAAGRGGPVRVGIEEKHANVVVRQGVPRDRHAYGVRRVEAGRVEEWPTDDENASGAGAGG